MLKNLFNTIRGGKGGKDRVTVLPDSLVDLLQLQLEQARALHVEDMKDGL